jgi:endogenous inhibitor of DNA gyrase (YacG/DUF329 family)
MSATAGYPAGKAVSNDTAASKRRCIGWTVDRNSILIHCPDLVTSWNPRCVYHSSACVHRTLELVKRGLVLGDRIVFLKACARCGKKFKTRRPTQLFCLATCRQKNYSIHNSEKIKAYKKVWNASNRPRKQPELKACAHCAKNFESSISWQTFCSEKCRDADHHRRHREKIAASRKIWMAANRDKVRAAVRRHHARHRDALNANSKARYAAKKLRLAEAERTAALARLPDDWDEAPQLDRVIGVLLISNRNVMNREIGALLDAMGWKCPFGRYGDRWETALSKSGSAANHVTDLRKWMRVPGKTIAPRRRSITI